MRNEIASGGGINWCWYHWLTIDDETRTVVETRADRFHNFNEWQGADDHPTPTVKEYRVYNRPFASPSYIKTWGAEHFTNREAKWSKDLAEWKLPADTKSVAVIDGHAYAFRAYQT